MIFKLLYFIILVTKIRKNMLPWFVHSSAIRIRSKCRSLNFLCSTSWNERSLFSHYFLIIHTSNLIFVLHTNSFARVSEVWLIADISIECGRSPTNFLKLDMDNCIVLYDQFSLKWNYFVLIFPSNYAFII